MNRIVFVAGTDTGVGKTILTSLLAAFLSERRIVVAALKPVCSGGRGDARSIAKALGGDLSLDEINPWHFRTPIAPVLAAQMERRSVVKTQVIRHIRRFQNNYEVIVVEGAGGLLSPMGVDFDSRDLIIALDASPIIVAVNKLGAVNHILLTLEALPKEVRSRARVLMMEPRRPDLASRTNAKLLKKAGLGKVLNLPWLSGKHSWAGILQKPEIRKNLSKLLSWLKDN